jgi:hypothetical protein
VVPAEGCRDEDDNEGYGGQLERGQGKTLGGSQYTVEHHPHALAGGKNPRHSIRFIPVPDIFPTDSGIHQIPLLDEKEQLLCIDRERSVYPRPIEEKAAHICIERVRHGPVVVCEPFRLIQLSKSLINMSAQRERKS